MWAFAWPFRIVAITVSIVGIGGSLFAIGLMIWRAFGYGRSIDLEEEAKKFRGDVDQAAAFIRSVLYIGLGCLNLALMALVIGVLGRSALAEIGFLACFLFSTLALIVLWWLEREFAWPGLFVIPEARGMRGLFFARRDKRRRAQLEDRASGGPGQDQESETDQGQE